MTPRKPKVLIVDDHAGQRLALAAVLADLDVTIVEAASGREALRCLLQHEVAVILLDVNMPGLDGFETAALIRERSRSQYTPIIFVTAFSDDAHAARGYSLGAVDYILSPVQPNVLRSKVGVFIDLDRKTEQITQQREALRRYAEQLQQLSRASLAIHSSRSVDDVARAVARNAGRIVGARQTSITLALHDDGEALTVTAVTEADGAIRETLSQPPTHHLARNLSQPQRLTQVALEARFLGATPPPSIIPELAMRGWLAAPLATRDGRSIGVVQLSDKFEGEFTAEDEGIVVLLAQKAAVAIENIAAAEAREANRLKDEFLGVLSHELRTPLQAMLTWIAILRKEPPDAALLARSLDVLDRSARSQVQLIADLLDVSRIIRGQLRLDTAPVEVTKVISLGLEALKPSATAKGVTLAWKPPASDCWIVGDSARLQQIVWNLVANGIKFTPSQGRVEVELDTSDVDVTIRVRDTGNGIPAAFLPYVFDRFRQADSTTERQHGGLGLGLSIVRHLVELHGGKVRAENVAPGSGALITIVLPRVSLAQPVSLVSGPSAHPAATNGGNGLRLDGINVVLVEDEPDAREALTTALERFGAAVVAVESVAAALLALKQHTPDVLLSDIGMPVEDGYALIRKVRAAEIDGAHLPAAALTAYARAEDRTAVLQAGFDTHVQKPIEPDDLARIVAQLTKRV
jgi:signal transduction histidine kinase/two-component SAPR family response regulator